MIACHVSALPQVAALAFAFEWSSLALPLIWFGVIVLTLIVESQTADLVAIWFAPSAFVSLILSFFNVQFWVQFGIFIGLTVVGLILSFTLIRPMMKKRIKIEKTNVDAMAGKLALVEEDVNNEDLASEDETVRNTALDYVKKDLKAVLDNVNAIKAKVEIVNAKTELLKNVYDAFVKDGAVSAAYLADMKAKVEESAAMKVEADAALATANETLEAAKTLAAKASVKVEDVETPVVDTPTAPTETVTQGYNKYFVDDGSLVAVTYGGKNGVDADPYRTFLLNYNYYAVIVVYNGTTYEIQPYDYAVINY